MFRKIKRPPEMTQHNARASPNGHLSFHLSYFKKAPLASHRQALVMAGRLTARPRRKRKTFQAARFGI